MAVARTSTTDAGLPIGLRIVDARLGSLVTAVSPKRARARACPGIGGLGEKVRSIVQALRKPVSTPWTSSSRRAQSPQVRSSAALRGSTAKVAQVAAGRAKGEGEDAPEMLGIIQHRFGLQTGKGPFRGPPH